MPLRAPHQDKSIFGQKVDLAIFAILPRLHLARVSFDCAEILVRAPACPKELPNQFLAQTDNTRARWSLGKIAILGVKGYPLWILSKTKSVAKKALLGTFRFSRGSKSLIQLVLPGQNFFQSNLKSNAKSHFWPFKSLSQVWAQDTKKAIFRVVFAAK